MTELFVTPHVHITHQGGVLTIQRTRAAYADPEAFAHEVQTGMAEIDAAGLNVVGMVIDSREALGRNDDAFEDVARRLTELALDRVQRVAVLMKSAVGSLQANRMVGTNERILITTDEAAAERFAAGS